jgi:general secretion pathway protein J
MRRRGGFTLIEVLIALGITALVATLAFSSLSATLSSVEGLRDSGERISEINRAWVLISRDIGAFAPRPIRNEFGARESALFGGEAAGRSLVFTRSGWHNPGRYTRSNLQRLRYVFEDNTLWRESYPVLDRTNETEAQRVALITGVESFEMAFLGPATELRGDSLDTDEWPNNWGINNDNNQVAPPEAVELRLELEDWGEVRWLYDLPRP